MGCLLLLKEHTHFYHVQEEEANENGGGGVALRCVYLCACLGTRMCNVLFIERAL